MGLLCSHLNMYDRLCSFLMFIGFIILKNYFPSLSDLYLLIPTTFPK